MLIVLPKELDELKALPQWVAFKLVVEKGQTQTRKIPLNPRTGTGAKANDASTWATFDEAVAFAERNGYFKNRTGGIGFEFANGYAGVDLDNVILPDGTLKPYAREIVELMNSYTEISVSGKGLHILCKGSLSDIGTRRKNDELGVEAYSEGRYFTVTGQVYGDVKPIAERTAELKKVYQKYLAKSEKTSKPEKGGALVQAERVPSEDLSDNELWERMFASAHGSKIRALYNGDISGYTSTHYDGNTYSNPSGADMALCCYLAYWTGNDRARIERMFRQSKLYRDKWERSDYRERTISEAIRLVPTYIQQVGSYSAKDTSVATVEKSSQGVVSRLSESVPEWTPPMTGYDYVDSGALKADLERFQKFPEIHTGFQNFDEAQGGLTSGMYVLGATPGLGKTTFLVQMSDNIAKTGNFVLYFSLEQSRLELTTKSISRLTAQRDIKNAVSAINIRRGQYVSNAQREAVERAIADYQLFSKNVAIVELGLDTTIATIVGIITKFIDNFGLRPVVMIDYLQVVKPDKEKSTTKDAVEYVVGAFKKLQVDNNLVLFLISSFNRQNYLTPVDYESFKETGALEYTCDVLLGLQPQVLTDELFNSDKKIKEKRDAIDKAISAIPRKVMLKNLKNRFGRKGYACGFTYNPCYDLFVPDMSFKVSNNEQTAVL